MDFWLSDAVPMSVLRNVQRPGCILAERQFNGPANFDANSLQWMRPLTTVVTIQQPIRG